MKTRETTIRLPRLPFAPDALEPVLSADAVRYHHEHHHAGYVRAVNELAADCGLEGATLERVIGNATGPLANAAAQVWNHTFYWNSMASAPGRPDAALLRAINHCFGSRVALARLFKREAQQLFGSGWTWLVAADDGSLEVIATPNAGLRMHEEGWCPLLVCDVWEHAYYVDYRGARAAYLDGFWRIADWQAASRRFAALRAGNGQRRRARDSRQRRWDGSPRGSWHPAVAARDRAD